MKRGIAFVLPVLLLMCSACANDTSAKDKTAESYINEGQSEDDESASDESVNIITPDVSSETTVNEPSWARGTQKESESFKNLNLDGIGYADDEAYVSVYQFGDYDDYENEITVIRIRLGTGEVLAKIFPVHGHYSLLAGKLFSKEKDAIVLQISDPTSNYGASTVYALNVNPIGVDPIPTLTTRLNTADSIKLTDGNIIENSILSNHVIDGTQIVDIPDMPQQGLLITFIGNNIDGTGNQQEIKRTLYWGDNGWEILSEEIKPYS